MQDKLSLTELREYAKDHVGILPRELPKGGYAVDFPGKTHNIIAYPEEDIDSQEETIIEGYDTKEYSNEEMALEAIMEWFETI